MAHDEACQLYIKQEIEGGLENGKTPYAIGKELSVWVQRVFEVNIPAETIKKQAQRVKHAQGNILGTNVPNPATPQDNLENEKNLTLSNINDLPDSQYKSISNMGHREGAGRPPKYQEKTVMEFLAGMGEEACKELKRVKREKNLKKRTKIITEQNSLPEGKYQVVYADPPWQYEFATSTAREIENQYPTMNVEEIINIPVNELSGQDSVLFLWVTSPKLIEGIKVLQSWGFQYITCAVWDKEKIGMGYYFRQQHEILLVGKKGSLPTPAPKDRIGSVIRSPRCEHSKKPDIFYEIIENMYPNYKKLELFARKRRNDWQAWGNQV